MSKKTKEEVNRDIRKHHLFRRLLESKDFREWYQTEMLDDAERYCVYVTEECLPNYDKAMASGIIRFVKRKFSELKTVGSEKRLKQLKRQLEVLDGRDKDREPGSDRIPFGQF